MDVFTHIDPLRSYLVSRRGSAQASLGFVPTMGALHRGHAALVRASKQENMLTVCSIYVNPTQFNNPDDLKHYPRAEAQDMELLREEGCDAVFMPDHAQMYPRGFDVIRFHLGPLGDTLEGRFRPGHFSGVALVVSKLFHIVEPDVAYFGQKDYQQFKVISLLSEELCLPLSLRSVATVREQDGLAISSRNRLLTPRARAHAPVFFDILQVARKALERGDLMSVVRDEAHQRVEPLDGMKLEYLELADRVSLAPLNDRKDRQEAVLLIAGYADGVRLIDNIIL